MRDTSDMMEDALSEDTMMDCGGGGSESCDASGLEDLVHLATDLVADTSSSIRDAAERLLTLLGVDRENEELFSLFSSSSFSSPSPCPCPSPTPSLTSAPSSSSSSFSSMGEERNGGREEEAEEEEGQEDEEEVDEGVEVDVSELEDDGEEEKSTRLLRDLAASLAQELKYSKRKRNCFDTRQHQSMELMQDNGYCERSRNEMEGPGHCRQPGFSSKFGENHQRSFGAFTKDLADVPVPDLADLNHCPRTAEGSVEQARSSNGQPQLAGSWIAGWDACATEALRYLLEDEGLPADHPTVLSIKNHLDVQRERAFARYTVS